MKLSLRTTAQVGRPTKYTPKTIESLVEAAKAGLSNRGACRAAGISEDTLAAWRDTHPELAEEMESAREAGRVKALRQIQDQGPKDWRAAEAFLKLTSPEHRPGRDGVIAATIVHNPSSGIVVTPADIAEMQKNFRKFVLGNGGCDAIDKQR